MIRRASASDKKFKETVVLTHHFGGNAALMRRHQEFLSALGYDSIAFDYSLSSPASKLSVTQLLGRMHRGARSVWRGELQRILDDTPGEKFLFSFSFPSCAVLNVLAEDRRTDLRGWITDGGPFLNLWSCMNNYFRYEKPIAHPVTRGLATAGGVLFVGGPFYLRHMHQWLSQLDSQFPILSIRGGQDVLVPEEAIDSVFNRRKDLNLKILRLPQARHIQGLRQFPEIYQAAVGDFLRAHSRS